MKPWQIQDLEGATSNPKPNGKDKMKTIVGQKSLSYLISFFR
tara:strand:- start:410 stop:535 length:126 start_codon:yes stop_codon:yes gene_type:complete